MSSYVMEAKENYDPTRAAEADAGTFTRATFADAHFLSLAYDAVSRELVYQVTICQPLTDSTHATNTTGHALWDGATSIAAGATFSAATNFNLFIARKNIDTDAVTFYDTYDPAAVVPSSAFGDGTARRYVSDTALRDQYPTLTDPRTHNAWLHTESCNLHVFQAADDWTAQISPLRPAGNVNNAVLPVGMETDWVYVSEFSTNILPLTGNLYLVPRVTTAAETAADKLLAYATYAWPSIFQPTTLHSMSANPPRYQRTAMDNDGGFWVLSCYANRRGDNPDADIRLHRFTKPSAFVYPTPPSDGGFTDETPWGASTGPNALYDGYQVLPEGSGRLLIAFSPGRVQLNLLYSLFYQEDNLSLAPGAIGYTWYDTADASWASSVLATGYMTGGFVATGDPAAAKFYITGLFHQTNLYLDADNFYSDGDYAFRFIFVEVYDVEAGVLNTSDTRLVLVKLTWNTSGAPTVSLAIDEDGTWDASYLAYATAIANARVVWASMQQDALSFDLPFDAGIYDATTNSFLFSGMNSIFGTGDHMFQLDPAFTGRTSATGPLGTNAQPPLLKLSFVISPPRRYVQSMVRIGRPDASRPG